MRRFGSAGVVLVACVSCHAAASAGPPDASAPLSAASSIPSSMPSSTGDVEAAAPVPAVALSAPALPPSSRCDPGCASGQAAYAKLFGGSHRCMAVSKTFPDVVVAGKSASPTECSLEGVIYACCLHTVAEVASQELYRWPTSNEATRRAQAVAWVREVMLAFNTVLDGPAPPDFIKTRHPYSAPFGREQPNGGEIVWAWIREPGGKLPGVVYTKEEIQFSRDGSVSQVAIANEWVSYAPAPP